MKGAPTAVSYDTEFRVPESEGEQTRKLRSLYCQFFLSWGECNVTKGTRFETEAFSPMDAAAFIEVNGRSQKAKTTDPYSGNGHF